MTVIYYGWHLIPRWPLKSFFARLTEHLKFSQTWYLEEVLASIPWYIASGEKLSGFCRTNCGVLFCSVVLCCGFTSLNTGPWSHWCPFSNWSCVSVWHCTSVYLCSSSLQNLTVKQDLYSLLSVPWNYLADPVFVGVGFSPVRWWPCIRLYRPGINIVNGIHYIHKKCI